MWASPKVLKVKLLKKPANTPGGVLAGFFNNTRISGRQYSSDWQVMDTDVLVTAEIAN